MTMTMTDLTIACDLCRGTGHEIAPGWTYAQHWARAMAANPCVRCLGFARIDAPSTVRAAMDLAHHRGLWVLVGVPSWVAAVADRVGFRGPVVLLGTASEDDAIRAIVSLADESALIGLTVEQWRTARLVLPTLLCDAPTYWATAAPAC